MYGSRMRTLVRAYNNVAKNNKAYQEAEELCAQQKIKLDFLQSTHYQLQSLSKKITEEEGFWRDGILSTLEAEIMEDLAWVYPTDSYCVKLTSRVLRGKIHIESSVSSTYSKSLSGKIKNMQGRLFQQVVSFSALHGVMLLLGVKTAYIDEAFSGSSRKNIRRLNGLLSHLSERGFNLVMIAQDTAMADGISANRIFLKRTIDNKTLIAQEVI